MRHGALLLLAIAFAIPAYAQSIKPGPTATDYLFQCGAAFLITAHHNQDAGNAKEAEGYRKKFNDLKAQAEASFEKYRRPKSDAAAYMQKHVDTMSNLFEEDPKAEHRFMTLCDQRYPE